MTRTIANALMDLVRYQATGKGEDNAFPSEVLHVFASAENISRALLIHDAELLELVVNKHANEIGLHVSIRRVQKDGIFWHRFKLAHVAERLRGDVPKEFLDALNV